MSVPIPRRISRQVCRRAGGACEYCKLPQWSQEATFHIDHIHPRADGGLTTLENLALACVSCSLKKSARRFVRDPQTKLLAPLFHPRNDLWREHFRWTSTWRLVGLTPTGRATARALGMNRTAIVRIRRAWASMGDFRPDA